MAWPSAIAVVPLNAATALRTMAPVVFLNIRIPLLVGVLPRLVRAALLFDPASAGRAFRAVSVGILTPPRQFIS